VDKSQELPMRRLTYRGCLVSVLVLIACCDALAQDSSHVWVRAIGPPQYFAVLVKDVGRSVEWYRKVFGLRELGGGEAEDGSWKIDNLRNEKLFVEIIRDDRAREADRARGFRKVGFQVPDVETVADRVGRATGERPRVLDFERFGVRIIQIRDPDGNIIQLFSPLKKQR
jgi:catechol 2,3-dioxygenase-like lactoylglutathione lyase family enzyme